MYDDLTHRYRCISLLLHPVEIAYEPALTNELRQGQWYGQLLI